MKPKPAKSQQGGIHIGGNVNTGGGSIGGRDVNNISVHVETRQETVNQLFAPVRKAVARKEKLTSNEREILLQKIEALETEVGRAKPAQKKVEGLLGDVLKMAPDILEVVIATISNPMIGLATVAQKVSQKAKETNGT